MESEEKPSEEIPAVEEEKIEVLASAKESTKDTTVVADAPQEEISTEEVNDESSDSSEEK